MGLIIKINFREWGLWWQLLDFLSIDDGFLLYWRVEDLGVAIVEKGIKCDGIIAFLKEVLGGRIIGWEEVLGKEGRELMGWWALG